MNPACNQERVTATGARKSDTAVEEPAVHQGPERRRPVIDSYSRVLQALDAGGVGTWEWDLMSGRFSTSATHDRLFGYAPGDSPGTVESSVERVHPDDRAMQRAAIAQSREQHSDLRQEFRIVLPDGTERWIQRVGRFVGHGHGLMAGTSVDVTERRASENAVRETEQQYREALGALYQAERVARAEAERARSDAEIANRAKTEFLAVMSHELRTPLNAIAGYTDLLAFGIRGPVTAEQREDLGRIQRAEQHLLGLINQVLSYARIETGAMGYDLKPVPVLPTIRAVEHLMTPQLAAKEITLQFGGCDPNLAVRADSDPLRQILLNLVGNAVKFTDRGGQIMIDARTSGDTVDVRVEDTGIGISPDQLDYIFEPFVQVDPRLTRSEGGVGLGLAISRDLARGMGGDIAVTSRVGEGSVFTLRLLREVFAT
jgi:signal transduction histidine kinase